MSVLLLLAGPAALTCSRPSWSFAQYRCYCLLPHVGLVHLSCGSVPWLPDWFCSGGHLLLGMRPTLRLVCFFSQSPLEKINFLFASGYHVKRASALGLRACIAPQCWDPSWDSPLKTLLMLLQSLSAFCASFCLCLEGLLSSVSPTPSVSYILSTSSTSGFPKLWRERDDGVIAFRAEYFKVFTLYILSGCGCLYLFSSASEGNFSNES